MNELKEKELELVQGGLWPIIIGGIALGQTAKKLYNKYSSESEN